VADFAHDSGLSRLTRARRSTHPWLARALASLAHQGIAHQGRGALGGWRVVWVRRPPYHLVSPSKCDPSSKWAVSSTLRRREQRPDRDDRVVPLHKCQAPESQRMVVSY